MDFNLIKTAVAGQWARMQKHPMFRVAAEPEELWGAYLQAFPPGTNPLYRERTEHDCSCCRGFIRTVGNVVAVIDGELVSLWDAEPQEPAYAAVCVALSQLVKSRPIVEPFVHWEAVAGTDRTFEQITSTVEPAEVVRTWTHFFVHIDSRLVKPKDEIPTWLNEQRTRHDVLLRSLTEITPDAIEAVLDLISQGSLYRGEEHRALVEQFRALKLEFSDLLPDDRSKSLFAWIADASGAVSRMRSTVIGTLLTDLSEDRDLEEAVKAFEAKVAPMNYKRPTALVSPAMVQRAKDKLSELGLLSALERRYATVRDLSPANVLFVDRSAPNRNLLQGDAGDVFDALAESAGARGRNLNFDRVEEVPIGTFVKEILPRATSLEVMFENRQQGNLVSLIAPADPTAPQLFKWSSGFSWSYAGEVADAIKERVKRAGGNVTGDLCCRLAWHSFDDLDLHIKEPHGPRDEGWHIFFGNKKSPRTGGCLDVDMNVYPNTREPVENIFYPQSRKMVEGEYSLFVNQFSSREPALAGFEVEIDYLGQVHRFSYDKPIRTGENVLVARFNYSHKGGIEIVESLPMTQFARELWGITTQNWHRVRLLTLSPNHWDENGTLSGVGNKHWFFILDGCKNDGTARGYYNEFLREDLTPHRKVLETVGARMRVPEAEEQLSGLGFSSTRHDTVVCRVRGAITRVVRVVF